MTRERYRRSLEELDRQMLAMAELARGMLRDGLASLERGDPELAEQVAVRTTALADADERIETTALGILMLQAPVATDLRRIASALKLITYYNRIGRYGFDIAKVAKEAKAPALDGIAQVGLRQMGRNVDAMLGLVQEAMARHAKADETALLRLEEEVDQQRASIFREALTYMLQDPRSIEPGAHVMMVARYLERCGDNVMKMAEKLHYAATGERVVLN